MDLCLADPSSWSRRITATSSALLSSLTCFLLSFSSLLSCPSGITSVSCLGVFASLSFVCLYVVDANVNAVGLTLFFSCHYQVTLWPFFWVHRHPSPCQPLVTFLLVRPKRHCWFEYVKSRLFAETGASVGVCVLTIRSCHCFITCSPLLLA
jgi:hypothetical protein